MYVQPWYDPGYFKEHGHYLGGARVRLKTFGTLCAICSMMALAVGKLTACIHTHTTQDKDLKGMAA